MNGYRFTLSGAALTALPSGALWWQGEGLLAVSDLHLGRSGRIARLGGTLIPPYEADDTLTRLDDDIARTGARTVLCLGDSFDDMAAADEGGAAADRLARLMAGRRWIWIAGNHDPGPITVGGEHRAAFRLGPLTFRHITEPGETGEVSGHYHPKARIAGQSRRCFIFDAERLILPAFGAYTGGLSARDPALSRLFPAGALAVLTGTVATAVPLFR
ncbi:MAG: ligase-associated DNA damage response endonuclease PdeM [Paracoccaceae bacterium]